MSGSIHHYGLLSLAVLAVGCGGVKEYEPDASSARTLFMPSMRTVAPEPVYARTRWVRAPDNLPQRERAGESPMEGVSEAPRLRSVFQLSLKAVSLEEAAKVLAATSRYSSYTAPSIAEEKISIENLGTIDELARIIEREARIQVVVDHQNKEVRFLAAHSAEPRLYDE